MSRHRNRQPSNHVPPLRPPEQDKRNTVTVRKETFSGPLPPPAVLEQYDRIVPGAAARILSMAERQAVHRQALEQTVVQGNAVVQRRGQVLGFVLALSALIIGGLLIWNDKETEGLTTIITDITALVGLFVYGRIAQERERREKLEAVTAPSPDSN